MSSFIMFKKRFKNMFYLTVTQTSCQFLFNFFHIPKIFVKFSLCCLISLTNYLVFLFLLVNYTLKYVVIVLTKCYKCFN